MSREVLTRIGLGVVTMATGISLSRSVSVPIENKSDFKLGFGCGVINDGKELACDGSITFQANDGCTVDSAYPNCIQQYRTVTVPCVKLWEGTEFEHCGTCVGSGDCVSAGGYDDTCGIGWNSVDGYYCEVRRDCIECRGCR